jgi:hypothetical protein
MSNSRNHRATISLAQYARCRSSTRRRRVSHFHQTATTAQLGTTESEIGCTMVARWLRDAARWLRRYPAAQPSMTPSASRKPAPAACKSDTLRL